MENVQISLTMLMIKNSETNQLARKKHYFFKNSNDFIQNPVIPSLFARRRFGVQSVVPVAPWRETRDAATMTAPDLVWLSVPEKTQTSSQVKYQKSDLWFREIGQQDAEPEAHHDKYK